MLFKEIENTIELLIKIDSISNERKKELQPLIDFIQKKTSEHRKNTRYDN